MATNTQANKDLLIQKLDYTHVKYKGGSPTLSFSAFREEFRGVIVCCFVSVPVVVFTFLSGHFVVVWLTFQQEMLTVPSYRAFGPGTLDLYPVGWLPMTPKPKYMTVGEYHIGPSWYPTLVITWLTLWNDCSLVRFLAKNYLGLGKDHILGSNKYISHVS